MKIFSSQIANLLLGGPPRQVAKSLVDVVLPPVCPLCGHRRDREQPWCRSCQVSLKSQKISPENSCGRCGHPSPAQSSCLGCETLRDAPIDRGVADFQYLGPVCDMVVSSKYLTRQPLAMTLGRCLGDRVKQADFTGLADQPISVVTWVPSHFTRRWIRGGNSAQIIAQQVAAAIACPAIDLLQVTRRIDKQAWLSDSQRARNVDGAFSVRKSYAWAGRATTTQNWIVGRHLLIVDDVMTTGATVGEIARILKLAGAARVSVAVVARAVRKP